ncbi:GNAT family N-acetyltransferase [Pleionea litopenaei]|uniref:GNAT family N-acetyltransferase n=1 Tax=Pleionea litopenaei TaxID=3070815 RepID=A0AA51RX44_9GAMM|nr:GNAT family N-acetyltransferase [Pleionea sp. HL-JVS1]WMS89190.1 GNAT family N-acetyltransferase [Pleionea sp. HL-JVS1]
MALFESLTLLREQLTELGFRLPILVIDERCAEGQPLDLSQLLTELEPVLSIFDANARGLLVTPNVIDNADQYFESKLTLESPKEAFSLLGKEYDFVILDGRESLRANLLAAVAGMVTAGGFLMLIAPPSGMWSQLTQREEHRLFGQSLQTGSHFMRRVESFCGRPEVLKLMLAKSGIQESAALTEIKRSQLLLQQLTDAFKAKGQSHSPTSRNVINQPSQADAVAAVAQVFRGHAKRHLVLTADRGRGKSSAMGLAAAELISDTGKRLVVTGPSRASVAQVESWFQKTATSQWHSHLCFYPVDEVVKRLRSGSLTVAGKPADGILIDEAAAIPTSMLAQLLERSNRLVFATTIHGYEGNGRGFKLRFLPHLKQAAPQSRLLHLEQPIRWHAGDILESWIDELLMLRSHAITSTSGDVLGSESLAKVEAACLEANDSSAAAEEINHTSQRESQELCWFKPGETLPDNLLHSAFALLVDSHYQTTPDDLRQLMDHPSRHCFCILGANNQVQAVAVVLQEGALEPSLIQGIINGQRRVRGHLVAQSLAFHCQQRALAEAASWRIQRIAVLEERRRQGLGSQLIESICDHASQLHQAFVSTSFAMSIDVFKFWSRAQFTAARVGLKKDKVSGCHSLIMLRSVQRVSAIDQVVSEFYSHTQLLLRRQLRGLSAMECVFLLHRRGNDDSVISTECLDTSAVKPEVGHNQTLQKLVDWQRLEQFSQGVLGSAEVVSDIEGLLTRTLLKKQLSGPQRHALSLLIAYYWQVKSLEELAVEFGVNGQKSLTEQLQKAVSELTQECASNE